MINAFLESGGSELVTVKDDIYGRTPHCIGYATTPPIMLIVAELHKLAVSRPRQIIYLLEANGKRQTANGKGQAIIPEQAQNSNN